VAIFRKKLYGWPPILFECGEGPENTEMRKKLHEYIESLGYEIEHVILDNYLAKFKYAGPV
jgi:hypothetical protein